MAAINAPVNYKFMIGTTDITAYVVNADGEREYTEAVKSCTISVNNSVTSILNINSTIGGNMVTIQRGSVTSTDYYLFRGYIVDYKFDPSGYTFTCKNKYYNAQVREATRSYDKDIDPQQGVISEIYKSLIDNFTDLQYSPFSIQNSGSIMKLTKFVCNHSIVYERADDLTQALNWQHYYNDYDDYVYFEPRGFVDSGVTLTVGKEIVAMPQWSRDFKKLCNSLTVTGSLLSVQDTKYYNGTNADAQKSVLPNTPSSVKVYVGSGTYNPTAGTRPSDTENNLRKGGKVNSTSGTFDYTYDDDQKVKTVYFADSSKGSNPSYTPPTGTNNIEVQYTYDVATPVKSKRQVSIDAYYLAEKTIKKDDIKVVADAEVYVENYLDRFSQPFLSTTTKVTGVDNIVPGRIYTIVDAQNNINEKMVITKIKFFYPYKPDEVTIGDEISKTQDFDTNIADRVKRLEEKEINTSDLLLQIFGDTITVPFEPRSFELRRRNAAGSALWDLAYWDTDTWNETWNTGFILDSAVAGVLDTNKLGISGNAEVLLKLIPGNNVYKEYILDTEYYDSVNSIGVTWDTTQRKITITDQLTSNIITCGVPIDTAQVVLPNITYYYIKDPAGEWLFDSGNVNDTIGTNNGSLLPYTSNISSAGEWLFDGADADDTSGNNRTGVVTGATLTTDRNGLSNMAYNFTTADDITFPYGGGLNTATVPISFCGWVKSEDASQSRIAFSFGTTVGTNQRLYVGHTGGSWGVGIQSVSYSSWILMFPKTATTNWTFLSVVLNNGTLDFYVDGGLVGTLGSITSFTTSGNFNIGNLTGSEWVGKADDVRLYTQALTSAQVSVLYHEATLAKPGLKAPILTTDRFSLSNKAYSFPGIAGVRIALPYALSGYNESISFWMNPTSKNTSDIIVSSYNRIKITFYSKYLRVQYKDQSGTWRAITGTTDIPFGSWTFITVTYDGVNLPVLYVNGVAEGSSSMYAGGDVGTLGVIEIGGAADGWGAKYDGALDDFRVYSYILSQDNINTLYAETSSNKDGLRSLSGNSLTGVCGIEISADNKKTWQSLTQNNITTINSSDGTNTYLRLSPTTSSSIILSNVVVSQKTSDCAIKIYFKYK